MLRKRQEGVGAGSMGRNPATGRVGAKPRGMHPAGNPVLGLEATQGAYENGTEAVMEAPFRGVVLPEGLREVYLGQGLASQGHESPPEQDGKGPDCASSALDPCRPP